MTTLFDEDIADRRRRWGPISADLLQLAFMAMQRAVAAVQPRPISDREATRLVARIYDRLALRCWPDMPVDDDERARLVERVIELCALGDLVERMIALFDAEQGRGGRVVWLEIAGDDVSAAAVPPARVPPGEAELGPENLNAIVGDADTFATRLPGAELIGDAGNGCSNQEVREMLEVLVVLAKEGFLPSELRASRDAAGARRRPRCDDVIEGLTGGTGRIDPQMLDRLSRESRSEWATRLNVDRRTYRRGLGELKRRVALGEVALSREERVTAPGPSAPDSEARKTP
jgi:hypothetical protein